VRRFPAGRNVDTCKRLNGASANACALPVAHRSGRRAGAAGKAWTGTSVGLRRDLLCAWHEHLERYADFPASRGRQVC
jgi:hypothetical protein